MFAFWACRRLNQALGKQLQGLAERLRRRGAAIARAIRTATTLVEGFAAIARRHAGKRESEPEYWRQAQGHGEKGAVMDEVKDSIEQSRKRAIRR